MNTVERLKVAEQSILAALRDEIPNDYSVVENFDIELMLTSISNAAPYSKLPDTLVTQCRYNAANSGDDTRSAFARLLLLRAIRHWSDLDFPYPSKGHIRGIYNREIDRLLTDIEDERSTYEFDLNSDVYIKDLQCFSGRMVACGAQVVDLRSGMPRKLILTDGLLNLTRNCSFLLRTGGFAPFCEIHTHTPTLSDFNSEGWDECYRCIAEILEVNRSLKGMIGSSWFYDPALESVSPNLRYLRHRPLENGAKLFRIGPLPASKRDALATSKTRNKLHDEGKYIPTHYALVWPRDELLQWAQS